MEEKKTLQFQKVIPSSKTSYLIKTFAFIWFSHAFFLFVFFFLINFFSP